MKNKIIFKLIPIVGLLAILVVIVSYFILPKNRDTSKSTLTDSAFGWKFPTSAKFPLTGSTENAIAYSDIRDPGGIPRGLPVRLKIPTIGVNSVIEDAFISSDGRMDVPAGSVNVAWFALGPHPGQIGSAVIGGHFGIDNGIPKVFFDLNKLKVGDKIYIEDDKGQTLAFIVRSTKSFDRDADPTSVFTSSDGLAHLNLITCEGVWNQIDDSYPQRLVIFTDAIPAEGNVVVTPKLPLTAAITPKITPTFAPPMETISPTSTLVAEKSDLPGLPLAKDIKSLYSNPLDGIITTTLLGVSIFLIIKFFKK